MLRIWAMILSAANLLLSAAVELPGVGGWGVCESHELLEAMVTGLRIPGLGEARDLASSPPTLQTQIFLSIKRWGGGCWKESWIFKFSPPTPPTPGLQKPFFKEKLAEEAHCVRVPLELLLCLKWKLGLCSSHSLPSLRRTPEFL